MFPLAALACTHQNKPVATSPDPTMMLGQVQTMADLAPLARTSHTTSVEDDPVILGLAVMAEALRARLQHDQTALEVVRSQGLKCLARDSSYRARSLQGAQVGELSILSDAFGGCIEGTALAWATWLSWRGPGARVDCAPVSALLSEVARRSAAPWPEVLTLEIHAVCDLEISSESMVMGAPTPHPMLDVAMARILEQAGERQRAEELWNRAAEGPPLRDRGPIYLLDQEAMKVARER